MKEKLKSFSYIYEALASKRGLDIVGMDLKGNSSISDFFVLVTANSDVHIGTLRDVSVEALEKKGHTCIIEGRDSTQWCLIDAGEVVVHVFSVKGRAFYKLDSIWGDSDILKYTYED